MGVPISPKTIYSIWDSAASLDPRNIPLKITKNVCNVIGTGPIGILIKAPMAVSAVNMETNTIS